MEHFIFYLKLNKKISETFERKEFDVCKRKIAIQLERAEEFKSDWNYWNIIHISYTYLGLIAIEENEMEKAKAYLIISGKIKGSPQSKSFGPDMLLAEKLLEKGETKIDLEYLDLCKKFWSRFLRFGRIRKWKREIKKGEIPNFGANLIHHLDMHKVETFAKMI